jgi:GT2 family glycosyltransferase
VAVIIPTVDGPRLLPACLEALEAQRYPRFRVVVVDNDDGRNAEWLQARHSRVETLQAGRNVGFAAAVNAGIAATGEPLIALLNDDARPEPDWLSHLVAAIQGEGEDESASDRLSFVCGKVVADTDPGRLDSAGDGMSRLLFPYPIGRFEPDRGQYQRARPVLLPPGSAVLFRRALFEDVGAFESSFFAYMEDADLGLRAALLGHRGRYVPEAVARHIGSATSGSMINAFTVRLSTRNLVRTQVRTLPWGVMLARVHRLLAGHLYWCLKMAVKEGHPLAWLAGLVTSAGSLRRDLGERRKLMKRRRIDDRSFKAKLDASAADVRASIRRKRQAR